MIYKDINKLKENIIHNKVDKIYFNNGYWIKFNDIKKEIGFFKFKEILGVTKNIEYFIKEILENKGLYVTNLKNEKIFNKFIAFELKKSNKSKEIIKPFNYNEIKHIIPTNWSNLKIYCTNGAYIKFEGIINKDTFYFNNKKAVPFFRSPFYDISYKNNEYKPLYYSIRI